MMNLLICTVYFICLFIGTRADDNLLVSLEDGLIRGSYKVSYNGRKFAAFEGIPYAQPPIQDLRFEDPQPVEPWTDILEANFSHTCAQLGLLPGNKLDMIGLEDCLYLNVYVPREKINPADGLDVIFHIHAGAFMIGSPAAFAYPTKIMDRDIVYVTVNYRLGPFGFFNIGDGRGNYGLKDQTAALKWVQRNIERFGGNKNSITISGLSAGGASVHLHYFSDLSKGLFHKGFAQSGVALNPWAFKVDYLRHGEILTEEVACSGGNTSDVYECLKRKSAGDIANAVKLLYRRPFLPLTPFGPVLEKNLSTSFLVESPYSRLVGKRVADLPLLISTVSEEGTTPAAVMYGRYDDLNNDWKKWAPLLLEYYRYEPEKQEVISEKIRKFYFKDEAITKDNFDVLVKACTHRDYHLGEEKTAHLQAQSSVSDIYFILMNYAGDFRPMNISGFDLNFGAGHGIDGKFYNDGLLIGAESLNKDEERMKDILLDMLVSFAKTGKAKIDAVDFQPVSKMGELNYLFIKGPDDISMKTTRKLVPKEFWESLGLNDFNPV